MFQDADDESELPWARTPLTGYEVTRNPKYNKGLAFSDTERDRLRLRGLLPPGVSSMAAQSDRCMAQVRNKSSDLERFIYLQGLCDRNEKLFYSLLNNNIEEIMPIIYTPTVGLACQQYGYIFRRPRGLFITDKDAGQVFNILKNWPEKDVKIIVVTDGERILGLGDLGCNGMGIPVGKLSLYCAAAGINPQHCLPIQIDVGTNNEELLADPNYIGQKQRRLRGAPYYALIDEFVKAVGRRYGPTCLIQWEDFGNTTAFDIMNKYAGVQCSFNDDIQGTASVAMAGIYASMKITQESLAESSFLFLGAGEAGTGIAELLSTAIAQESGKTVEEARKQVWLADSKGLITNKRDLAKLAHHKLPFAHQPPQKLMRRLSASAASSSGGGGDDSDEDLDFLAAIQAIRPAGIVGVSAQPQSFTKDMVEAMCDNNDRPIVFALSNPTSKAECTAEQAYEWSGGKAIFASGSPFDPVTMPDGTVRVPGQGNNAYIFPAVGMGCLVSGSTQVTDSMFLIAAQRLASLVTKKDLEMGLVYPQLGRLREVSLIIAAAVAEEAYRLGFASRTPKPDNLLSAVKAAAWQPTYRSML